ncbi:hypothetical protein ENBRE01_1712 [Enteropsectra breve]|nr:hypothetical protein ENBRE01_1712 [Enteropsectra breve]
MPSVYYRPKLTTADTQRIKIMNKRFYLDGKRVHEVEMCGVAFQTTNKTVSLFDFCGEVKLFKKGGTAVPLGGNMFIVRIFLLGNEISFFCKEARPACFYEEIAFHIEISELKNTKKYNA